MNKPDPRSELKKLGKGERIDHDLLYEQMEDDRLDKLLKTLRGNQQEAERDRPKQPHR